MLTTLVALILAVIGAYIYFDRKFTPEKNYLKVEKESSPIPLIWMGTDKNVLLLPVHFSGDTATYYLQFDTGSPYTVLYSNLIKNISQIILGNELAKASFSIGNSIITSDRFKVLDQGNESEGKNSIKIIGTLGADILEGRKTVINFQDNYVNLNLSEAPAKFKSMLFDFKFNKRKVIIRGTLNGKEEKFVFDSGTSAYELLTTQEEWQKLKSPDSKVKMEKSQSWERVLTSYTANCKQSIRFNTQDFPLSEVTYVEGFSQAQYSLMKFSGMTGMLGNKIFLNHNLYIDCVQHKIGID